ncbi:MAG: CARDB domain-containing protein [archaeon]
MPEQKQSSMMRYAIVTGMLVMLFLMFFRGWGLTAKFFAPSDPGALPVTEIGTPDLIPLGYSDDIFMDSTGTHHRYTLSVKNTGVADAGPFKTTLVSADGSIITSCRLNSIAAGAADSCIALADASSARIRLIVDSDFDVAESDEDNNIAVF